MRRKLIVTFSCFLFFAITIWAAKTDAQILNKIYATVVYLQREVPQTTKIDGEDYEIYLKPIGKEEFIPQTKKILGTGFLVVDGNLMFLVTAQHVASQMSGDSLAALRTSEDRPITYTLAKLSGTTCELEWVQHDKADVAVLLLHPGSEIMPNLKEHFLAKEMLSAKLEAPSRERPLTTIGFPLGLGVQERFSPISRESKPASGLLTIPRFDTKQPSTFYLLDNPSIGGFSGAPIFEMPGAHSSQGGLVIGGRLACVGLIHGTISDDTGGKLGAVVPSAFIVQTIDKARIGLSKK
jgi:hypothetical protein